MAALPGPALPVPALPVPALPLPPVAVLNGNPAWQVVDFISDLHLHTQDSATAAAFLRYALATPADALFILGDLFEVWVGDDVLLAPAATPPAGERLDRGPAAVGHGFESGICTALNQLSQRCAIFVMHGNRDFLLGAAFAQAAGATLLADPTQLNLPGTAGGYLLTHGDALCLADTAYQDFRAQVRSSAWQRDFLALPLAERQTMARNMRAQSDAKKQKDNAQGTAWADVDTSEALRWLHAAGSQHMIHGHTHRPAEHELGSTARPTAASAENASHNASHSASLNTSPNATPKTTPTTGMATAQRAAQRTARRTVLSDWDAAAQPARAQVLRWSAGGLVRLSAT